MGNLAASNAIDGNKGEGGPGKQLTLFYSYSHRDERYRDALAKHLALLKRKGLIREWYDRQIGAGEEWREAIDDNLLKADIILLLISADFIASDYCFEKEMELALKRHDQGEALVIPIIVRPVNWNGAPFGNLQALPKNGKPVTEWDNRDSAWENVAEGIRSRAEALSAGHPLQRVTSGPANVFTAGGVAIKTEEPPPATGADAGLFRMIYDAQNKATLPGRVVRREGEPSAGDVSVDEAYQALGTTYAFFKNIFGRDSIDGEGLPLKAVVHYQQDFCNGFWDGKQIVLGDGDGQLFNRFTQLDMIAHEYTFGVIQYSCGLLFWGQSGALTSSIADIFCCLVKQYQLNQTVDQADWLLGGGLFTSNVKGVGLRSIKEPGSAYDDPQLGKDPQSGHMRGYLNTENDNGGVHINSGIPAHAFYLLAENLGGHAWEKAGRIWYETLGDKHLKPKEKFQDFAQLTAANALRLYGPKSSELQAVKDAWNEVGIKVK